jgi:signal peptidase II
VRPSQRLATARRKIFLIASTLLALDQGTKWWAVSYLENRDSIEFLGGLLKLNHTTNSGAAFNIGSNLTLFLTSFAIIVATGLIIFARKVVEPRWVMGFGILLGGVLGNLTDRIFRAPQFLQGHVVDFIQLPNWPIFNIADMGITVAGILIAYLLFKDIQPFARFASGYADEQHAEDKND